MTLDRRELLTGAGCCAALGAATWLTPRRKLELMPAGTSLSTVVPNRLGAWHIGAAGDFVIPKTPGSLASKLYSDQLAREYGNDAFANDVMLLIAYGQAQSDLLQLHRPEVCYPAIGFQITFRRLFDLPVAPGVVIPAVMLTAQSSSRVEDIVYWTRLGEALPQTGREQSWARLEAAMHGYVGDGALVRASAVRTDSADLFDMLRAFMRAMVQSVPQSRLPALIGTRLAGQV